MSNKIKTVIENGFVNVILKDDRGLYIETLEIPDNIARSTVDELDLLQTRVAKAKERILRRAYLAAALEEVLENE